MPPTKKTAALPAPANITVVVEWKGKLLHTVNELCLFDDSYYHVTVDTSKKTRPRPRSLSVKQDSPITWDFDVTNIQAESFKVVSAVSLQDGTEYVVVEECPRPSVDISPAHLTDIQAHIDAGEMQITCGPWTFTPEGPRSADLYNMYSLRHANGHSWINLGSTKECFDAAVVAGCGVGTDESSSEPSSKRIKKEDDPVVSTDVWAERLAEWVYPRRKSKVVELPEFSSNDKTTSISSRVTVGEIPLTAFTVVGPWDVPFTAYRDLDEKNAEQITPLTSWLYDRERRRIVYSHKK